MKTKFKYAIVGASVTLIVALSIYIIAVMPSFRVLRENTKILGGQKKDPDKMIKSGLIKIIGPDNIAKARRYNDIGAYQSAIDICEKLKKKNDEDYEALIFEAELYISVKEYDKAKANLRKVLKVDYGNTWALRKMGDALRITGNRDEAEKFYNMVIKLDTAGERIDAACALYGLGELYAEKGKYTKALDLMNQAIAMNKNVSFDKYEYIQLEMKAKQ